MNEGEFLTPFKLTPTKAAKATKKDDGYYRIPHQAYSGMAAKPMLCPKTEAHSDSKHMRKSIYE
jgi:hypothetical protein